MHKAFFIRLLETKEIRVPTTVGSMQQARIFNRMRIPKTNFSIIFGKYHIFCRYNNKLSIYLACWFSNEKWDLVSLSSTIHRQLWPVWANQNHNLGNSVAPEHCSLLFSFFSNLSILGRNFADTRLMPR